MQRTFRVGSLLGLLLTFLSWATSLLTSAFPGAWVHTAGTVVNGATLVAFFWAGWSMGQADRTGLTGGLAGVIAGAFLGLLAGAPEAFFLAPHVATLTVGERFGAMIEALLSSAFLGGILGLLGGSLSVRRYRAH